MMMKKQVKIPEKGLTADALRAMLPGLKSTGADWAGGKVFGTVYHPGGMCVEIAREYREAFADESTLNPSLFPSLRYFEKEIVRMAAGLMNGGRGITGSVTTGGTESIFLALKTARDLASAERNTETKWEVVVPGTAHPAFLKACHFLSLKAVVVDPGEDGKADPQAMESAITDRTILLVCSAPCFPYGVVDPVPRIACIALKHRLLLHVDACMGGFVLPFMEELGHAVPRFDFRVPGVTSISLDAHKYGYAPKGVSIILYRSRKLREKQFFVHTEWPGGIFASTTFMGTKSGGTIAACWATMKYLGREGYLEITRRVMETTEKIREGIEGLADLYIIGEPDMTVLAFGSRKGMISGIGDALSSRGWHLDRLQYPDALHLTVTHLNTGMEKRFLQDLGEVMRELSHRDRKRSSGIPSSSVGSLTGLVPSALRSRLFRTAGRMMGRGKKGSGSHSAIYGISQGIRNRRNVREMVLHLLEGMY